MKIRLLLVALAALLLAMTACGGSGATGGSSIQGSGSSIGALTAEGLFIAGENEASVRAKIASNSLAFRAVEVERFLGGSVRSVFVTTNLNQPYVAFMFLPPSATAMGTMVVLRRADDIVESVIGWDCSSTQIFLKTGGITDFENEFCKVPAG